MYRSRNTAKTYELVFERIVQNKVRNLSNTSHNSPKYFKEEDKVLVYRPNIKEGESLKLSPSWYGPFIVTKVASNGKVYYLKDLQGDHLRFPVSILHLKEFNPREGEDVDSVQIPENPSQGVVTSKTLEDDSLDV